MSKSNYNTSDGLLEASTDFKDPVVCVLTLDEIPRSLIPHLFHLSFDVIMIESDEMLLLKLSQGRLIRKVMTIPEACHWADVHNSHKKRYDLFTYDSCWFALADKFKLQ